MGISTTLTFGPSVTDRMTSMRIVVNHSLFIVPTTHPLYLHSMPEALPILIFLSSAPFPFLFFSIISPQSNQNKIQKTLLGSISIHQILIYQAVDHQPQGQLGSSGGEKRDRGARAARQHRQRCRGVGWRPMAGVASERRRPRRRAEAAQAAWRATEIQEERQGSPSAVARGDD